MKSCLAIILAYFVLLSGCDKSGNPLSSSNLVRIGLGELPPAAMFSAQSIQEGGSKYSVSVADNSVIDFADGIFVAKKVGSTDVSISDGTQTVTVKVEVLDRTASVREGLNPLARNSYDFGKVDSPDSSDVSLTIENRGQTEFKVTGVRIVGEDADQFAVEGEQNWKLASNTASTPFKVLFKPTTRSGFKQAFLVFEDDSNGTPIINSVLRVKGISSLRSKSPVSQNFISMLLGDLGLRIDVNPLGIRTFDLPNLPSATGFSFTQADLNPDMFNHIGAEKFISTRSFLTIGRGTRGSVPNWWRFQVKNGQKSIASLGNVLSKAAFCLGGECYIWQYFDSPDRWVLIDETGQQVSGVPEQSGGLGGFVAVELNDRQVVAVWNDAGDDSFSTQSGYEHGYLTGHFMRQANISASLKSAVFEKTDTGLKLSMLNNPVIESGNQPSFGFSKNNGTWFLVTSNVPNTGASKRLFSVMVLSAKVNGLEWKPFTYDLTEASPTVLECPFQSGGSVLPRSVIPPI